MCHVFAYVSALKNHDGENWSQVGLSPNQMRGGEAVGRSRWDAEAAAPSRPQFGAFGALGDPAPRGCLDLELLPAK